MSNVCHRAWATPRQTVPCRRWCHLLTSIQGDAGVSAPPREGVAVLGAYAAPELSCPMGVAGDTLGTRAWPG